MLQAELEGLDIPEENIHIEKDRIKENNKFIMNPKLEFKAIPEKNKKQEGYYRYEVYEDGELVVNTLTFGYALQCFLNRITILK